MRIVAIDGENTLGRIAVASPYLIAICCKPQRDIGLHHHRALQSSGQAPGRFLDQKGPAHLLLQVAKRPFQPGAGVFDP